MTNKYVRKYCSLTDKSLHEIYIPTEAVSCKNVHCSDENHIDAINKLLTYLLFLWLFPSCRVAGMTDDLSSPLSVIVDLA